MKKLILIAGFSGWTDTRIVGAIPTGTLKRLAVSLQPTGGWKGVRKD